MNATHGRDETQPKSRGRIVQSCNGCRIRKVKVQRLHARLFPRKFSYIAKAGVLSAIESSPAEHAVSGNGRQNALMTPMTLNDIISIKRMR
jgi:hypothetical protein